MPTQMKSLHVSDYAGLVGKGVDLIMKMMCGGEVRVMDTREFEEAKYVGWHVKLVDSDVKMEWDGVHLSEWK